ALDQGIFEAEKAAVAGVSGVRYVDTSDMLCDDRNCPAVVDGKLTYRDRQHLAVSYADSLARPLERAIFGERSVGLSDD
ncbi:SGNH hydrolase domain-containing protein, partial [Rhizobiaceae sp. 2RAB30]